jgi:hypothetical protein
MALAWLAVASYPTAHDWLQARKVRRVHGRVVLIGSRYDLQGLRLPAVLISK